MVIALMEGLEYKIEKKEKGKTLWLETNFGKSLDFMRMAVKCKEKITFVAQNTHRGYYYPWIVLQNINQR